MKHVHDFIELPGFLQKMQKAYCIGNILSIDCETWISMYSNGADEKPLKIMELSYIQNETCGVVAYDGTHFTIEHSSEWDILGQLRFKKSVTFEDDLTEELFFQYSLIHDFAHITYEQVQVCVKLFYIFKEMS